MLLVGAVAAQARTGRMNGAGQSLGQFCSVARADALPGSVGGAQEICGAIERAVAQAAPTAHYKVDVTVRSSSRLSAVVVVNGRSLPEQNFAVMDRNLDLGTVRRFAEALATEIAKAAKE